MSDQLPPLNESLPMQLLRAREVIMRRLRMSYVGKDLTEQQWRVLRVLMEVASIDMQRLAESAFIHAPSLSRIIPKLEIRGLIRRTPSKADRRQTFVELTEAGRVLFESIRPGMAAGFAQLQAGLGHERFKLIQEELARLIHDAGLLMPAGDEAVPAEGVLQETV